MVEAADERSLHEIRGVGGANFCPQEDWRMWLKVVPLRV